MIGRCYEIVYIQRQDCSVLSLLSVRLPVNSITQVTDEFLLNVGHNKQSLRLWQ